MYHIQLFTTPIILLVRERNWGKELLALAKGETYACEFHLYTYIYDFQIFLSSKFTITLLFCVNMYFDDQNSRTTYIFRLLATNFNLCMLYIYIYIDLIWNLQKRRKSYFQNELRQVPNWIFHFSFSFFDFFFKYWIFHLLRSQFQFPDGPK